MEQEMIPLYKVFSVVINDKPYDVYNIQGKEHPGWNGEVKTWWVYYSEPLPEGAIPPVDSEFWKPLTKGLERECWDIRFKQQNYTKVKWDELDFRNSTSVEMWCNGRKVYEFSTWGGEKGIAYAMAKVQFLQVKMSEHPYNFLDPNQEIGRKIWWYGLPAMIAPKHDAWEIGILPDYTAGLDKAEWWQEYSRRMSKTPKPQLESWEVNMSGFSADEVFQDYINWGDALSDGHIDWFRK